MRRGFGIGLAVLALSTTGLVQPAGAEPSRTETEVRDFTGQQVGPVIEGATAALTRTANGLSAQVMTTLPAGHAETMWWVVFNRPGNCAGACGGDDVVAAMGGHNPAEIAVLNADGGVVPPSERETFAAQLSIGSDGPGENLIPGGVTNPLGALVLLVVVDHGPAATDQETRYLQTHALTWPGACPNQTEGNPFGDCADTQIAIFPPPV